MKIIDPSYEIINDNDKPMEHIERIGRVCYKSEDKITEESAPKFVKMLMGRNHFSVLEHFIFVVEIPPEMYFDFNLVDHPYIGVTANGRGIISFSARAILEFKEAVKETIIYSTSCIEDLSKDIDIVIAAVVKTYSCPGLFKMESIPKETSQDVKVILHKDLWSYLTEEELSVHGSVSVRFICDRGVSHEIVRHRIASYSQESTRYCNYSNDKFGNELTFIKPLFFTEFTKDYAVWLDAMDDIQKSYFELINNGCKPQEARSVLPNSIKTEIVMTARIDEWRHFFLMRDSAAAHPQMRELAVPLHEEFIKRGYIQEASKE